MNSFEDKNLKRIADAIERLIPSPINLKNLSSSNLFVLKTNPDQLINLENNNLLTLEMLIGINHNKKVLYNNTLQFAKGFSANNVLLWGARGTGKSSLVKLIHNKISSDYNSLKLIQVKKEDISLNL